MTRWMAAALAVWLAACGDDAELVTHGPAPFTVSPTAMTLAPGQTQQVVVLASGRALTPTTVSVADSCVALVSASGLVTGVGPGTTAVQVVLSTNGQTYTTSVPVTVAELAVLRLTIQSITTGAPPVSADVDAIRGSITVVANADPSQYASLDLLLLNRIVDSRPVSPDGRVALTVDTSTRDEAGAPLFPNGKQTLVLRGARRPAPPGCPTRVDVVQQAVTLANP